MEKKVIILTGASSGIGFQTAEKLARQGHVVYGAARQVEKMEPLKAFGGEHRRGGGRGYPGRRQG